MVCTARGKQAFMNTFKRLLNMLRNKGMLKVKHTILRNQDYLVMQLTGSMYQLPEQEGKAEAYKQDKAPERNPKSGRDIQNPQNSEDIIPINLFENKNCTLSIL